MTPESEKNTRSRLP